MINLKCNRSRYALALLLFCRSAVATTVITMVTPDGILIAADSLQGTQYIGNYTGPKSSPITKKIFLVHDRIAVATVGLGGQTLIAPDGTALVYDPATFIDFINKKTPKDVSVDSVILAIEKEFSPMLQILRVAIKNEIIKENADLPMFIFVVTGYDANTAIIREIRFYIDWKAKSVSDPEVYVIFPQYGHRTTFGLHPTGLDSAISEAIGGNDTRSRGYRMVMAQAPRELGLFRAYKDLTLQQAATLLHAFLRAQSKETPRSVGPPFRVVKILKKGGVEWVKYDN